ncbi:MAG: RecX family transcriptional regulator [Saprospiraceae bacterium]|nr:RecX family transcriptional regulator [Candidatus Opimibacter skivensis]
MSTPDKSDFLNRCMRYCSGAERCTQDVVKKLVTWEAPEDEYEVILETLRKEKFLDDTRYANSFVADKWRLDQWGKVKIRNGLFQKGISETLIQNAIDTIDQDGYVAVLHNLLEKKRVSIKKEAMTSQMKKLLSFGASRGFEEELIWQWMESKGLSFDQRE